MLEDIDTPIVDDVLAHIVAEQDALWAAEDVAGSTSPRQEDDSESPFHHSQGTGCVAAAGSSPPAGA
jgi:hypothetical protein